MDIDLLAPASADEKPVLVTRVTDDEMAPGVLEPLRAALGQGGPGSSLSDLISAIPTADGMDIVEHVVDADRGLIVRISRAADRAHETPLPCLYAIHGGGYIMGNRLMEDPLMARLCPDLGIVGVSVEYRLAPGTSYPGPLEDCYDGLAWIVAHADELGVDADRIGIYGGSAGGGLAAALALLIRDRNEFKIQFQTLMYPMIDDRQITPSSQLDGLAVWPREGNEQGWRAYLGDLYGAERLPIYAAAARAKDLSGLPPAFVAVGGLDGFRDENIDYAMRLYQAGVATELHVYPGGPHGYGIAADAPISRQGSRDVADWLRRQFARI